MPTPSELPAIKPQPSLGEVVKSLLCAIVCAPLIAAIALSVLAIVLLPVGALAVLLAFAKWLIS